MCIFVCARRTTIEASCEVKWLLGTVTRSDDEYRVSNATSTEKGKTESRQLPSQ